MHCGSGPFFLWHGCCHFPCNRALAAKISHGSTWRCDFVLCFKRFRSGSTLRAQSESGLLEVFREANLPNISSYLGALIMAVTMNYFYHGLDTNEAWINQT